MLIAEDAVEVDQEPDGRTLSRSWLDVSTAESLAVDKS